MSLKALVEVLIHLDSFRNIDLFYQGLYYVKLRMFYKRPSPVQLDPDTEPDTEVEMVQPYWHFPTQRQEERNARMKKAIADPHHLMEPCITDDQNSFVTKCFLIRYCEESVELNDVVMFRAEIDVEPDYLQTEFFLECELYFSDLSALGGPTGWKNNFADIKEELKIIINNQ